MLIVLVIVQVRFFQMRPRYLPDASHLIPIALSSPPPPENKNDCLGSHAGVIVVVVFGLGPGPQGMRRKRNLC